MRSHDPVEEVGTGVPEVVGGGDFRLGLFAGMGLSVVVPVVLERLCWVARRRRESKGGTRVRSEGSIFDNCLARNPLGSPA